MDEHRRANRDLWDEWAVVNARSELYRLAQFKAGENKLNPLERGEVGDVRGKTLLHLMCHFGMDTLSWARLGAVVTGVDFSPVAVRMARELSDETKVPGRFLCCELYDLPEHLQETFDLLVMTYGVLSWLPDLDGWARLVARYLRPGGRFYLAEIHPLSLLFDEKAGGVDWKIGYDYFHEGVLSFDVQGSYADPTAKVNAAKSHEWFYTLDRVVSALIREGLRLEFLHEHPFTVYQALPFLERREDGYWHPPSSVPRVPLLFSLRAVKEG
jgi:SAM-dependent methyltransferase